MDILEVSNHFAPRRVVELRVAAHKHRAQPDIGAALVFADAAQHPSSEDAVHDLIGVAHEAPARGRTAG